MSKTILLLMFALTTSSAFAQITNSTTTATQEEKIDSTPPTIIFFKVIDETATTVTVNFTAIDNVAVTAADLFINGAFTTEVKSNPITYTFTGLVPNSVYMFSVKAKDAAGNNSPGLCIYSSTKAMPIAKATIR